MFSIVYVDRVANDLAAMRAFDRRRILNRIDNELSHQPTHETRHKKIISGLTFPWDHEEPAWELRVGEYRVFYDVDVLVQQVTVRAVRQKPPHQPTEDIV